MRPSARARAALASAALAASVALALAARAAPADEGPVPRCAERPTLRGIDVSKWQGEIDWAAVRAAGVRFAYIRVSDGPGAIDPTFARNWEGARRAGIRRGAYQLFRPSEDADEQADLLLETVGAPRKGDLPPALDVEVADGVDAAAIVEGIARWLARVRRATGLPPVLYTSALNWATITQDSPRFRALPLWVAHHGADCPSTPGAWPRWTFHQSSAEGRIAGILAPVDENLFHGGRSALGRLALGDEAEAGARAAWRRWRRARERQLQAAGAGRYTQ